MKCVGCGKSIGENRDQKCPVCRSTKTCKICNARFRDSKQVERNCSKCRKKK